MLNDTLSNALSTILNSERIGRKDVEVRPVTKVTTKVLTLLNKFQYIGGFEQVSQGRGGVLKVHLLGNINKVGVIKPRYSIQVSDYQKFEKRYLPAFGMGVLIVSTSKGLMSHTQAKEQNLGGKLIAYCY